MDETDSVFRAWCDTHNVTYESTDDDQLRLDLGKVDSYSEVHRLLREGYQVWCELNREESVFRTAKYRFDKRSSQISTVHSHSESQWVTQVGAVWHVIDSCSQP
jgi:hypothetical protein